MGLQGLLHPLGCARRKDAALRMDRDTNGCSQSSFRGFMSDGQTYVMPNGRPQTFTVFVARHAGRRFEGEPSRGTRLRMLRLVIQLRSMAERDTHGDPSLELGQLALRRCLYLLREMLKIEKRAPEGCALVARCIIEHALVGAYLVLTPDVGGRFVKKQAKHSRRLRNRILSGDGSQVLDLLAESEFIRAPLATELNELKAAPDFAQIASQLDTHAPFNSTGLATLLYDEAYSFLSNYVEHPTPLSLGRHGRVNWFRQGWRRYAPQEGVHPLTLTHTAMPAIAALASCLARRQGVDHSSFDEWAADAAFADGYAWAGSPLRYASVTATLHAAGLSRRRADALGSVLRTVAIGDEMRSSTPAEQLVAVLEALEAAGSWRSLLQMVQSGKVPTRVAAIDLSDSASEVSSQANVAIAALYLAYTGLWPTDPTSLKSTLASACASSANVDSGGISRILRSQPPGLREAIRRMRARIDAFE
jgi:hypothetical protein